MNENQHINYVPTLPSGSDFHKLYNTTGWNKSERSAEQLIEAIKNSWYFISAYSGEKLIGCGRIISDGYLHAFITEMIIAPDFQNQGIGKEIISALVNKALDHGITDIQLFCAKGKEKFYLKNGFVMRPDDAPGMQYKLK